MTGKELRQIRQKLGLSQQKLANQLDVCRSSVYVYEVGEVKIPARVEHAVKLLASGNAGQAVENAINLLSNVKIEEQQPPNEPDTQF